MKQLVSSFPYHLNVLAFNTACRKLCPLCRDAAAWAGESLGGTVFSHSIPLWVALLALWLQFPITQLCGHAFALLRAGILSPTSQLKANIKEPLTND